MNLEALPWLILAEGSRMVHLGQSILTILNFGVPPGSCGNSV